MTGFYAVKVNVLKISLTMLLCGFILFMAVNFLKRMDNGRSADVYPNAEYVVLAMNDLGMHCIQHDFSSFMILPPGNNLKVQVFKKGGEQAELINKGIDVKYEMLGNTTSADKINFWEYAADYGYDIQPDVGITGNGLSGFMTLSPDKKYFEASAIPVTPYYDGSTELAPYQTAKVTVYDKSTGKIIAVCKSVVVPVSDEMKCSVCHGESNTELDILEAHDELSGTQLARDLKNNKRYKCADCHQDNAIGEEGKEGIEPLSQAIHGFHSTKMEETYISPECYSCHPGPVTQCNRGRMYMAGVSCDDPNCHGSMAKVAGSQKSGRQAWLQEPDCGNCHGTKYSSNQSLLYRNSYLMNAPGEEMNGKIQCEACHNSTHAEWTSALPIDNLIPESLQGTNSYINNCYVCHKGEGEVHRNESK